MLPEKMFLQLHWVALSLSHGFFWPFSAMIVDSVTLLNGSMHT